MRKYIIILILGMGGLAGCHQYVPPAPPVVTTTTTTTFDVVCMSTDCPPVPTTLAKEVK